mgnify:CR=1 FL=1
MKVSEMRMKSRQEILDEIDACGRELLNIQFQWQAGETKNPVQKRDIRRDIARLKTILREMDMSINTHLKAKEQV